VTTPLRTRRTRAQIIRRTAIRFLFLVAVLYGFGTLARLAADHPAVTWLIVLAVVLFAALYVLNTALDHVVDRLARRRP
jgi:diacylglycerol kinase